MKIVFFGASTYVLPVIEELAKSFTLSLVITTETSPADAVPAYCINNTIPFISVEKITRKLLDKILAIQAPVAVLAYFGIIIPDDVLYSFPKGIVNIHPSLLPKYRGTTPVQTAIKNGDSKTGVSIIKLDNQVDHGPILEQFGETIEPTDTTDSLHQRLFAKAAKILVTCIKNYMNNEITPREQDHSQATFTEKLSRKSGFVDSNHPPTKEDVDLLIRAYYPWPGVWTTLEVQPGKEKIIKLLPGKKVQMEGKNPVRLETFYQGYPELKPRLEKLYT